jgi:hypothetical protein
MRIELAPDRTSWRATTKGAQPVTETASHERAVTVRAPAGDQRNRTTAKDKHASINSRRRLKHAAWQPTRHRALVPRTPKNTAHAARPWQRALQRNPPLDDQIGTKKRRRRIIKQQMQKIVRAAERQVRDDAERLSRQPRLNGVSLDYLDVRPAATQTRRQTGIKLDRNHPAGDPGELRRQRPGARPKIDHQIARPNAGVTNQLCRQATRAKEVLATS